MESTKSGDDLRPILLSEDVWIQILAWLPVISLLRFKSVCKSWCAIIQSPFFIDLHIATTFNFDTFVLQVHRSPRWDTCLEIDLDTLEESDGSESDYPDEWMESVTKMIKVSFGSGGGEDKALDLHDLEFSSCYKKLWLDSSMYMLGSCNGLICLHDCNLKDLFLWNPATRQFRVLPKSITITIEKEEEEEEEEEEIELFDDDFFAFGFDVKTKDYKGVQITPLYLWKPNGKRWGCRVQVYSLSTDSWRLLEDINYLPFLPEQRQIFNHGIYLNGSYFFVGIIFPDSEVWTLDGRCIPVCNNRLMVSFDFTKEIFTTMQLPDHDTRHNLVISYLGDKIALFTGRASKIEFVPNDNDTDDNRYFDIWLLNEDDCGIVNKESWTKLYSFQRKIRVVPQPRCIFNGGEFALISCRVDDSWWSKLQFFNLVTKEVKKDIVVGNEVVRADVYNQSLVPIVGGNAAAARR